MPPAKLSYDELFAIRNTYYNTLTAHYKITGCGVGDTQAVIMVADMDTKIELDSRYPNVYVKYVVVPVVNPMYNI